MIIKSLIRLVNKLSHIENTVPNRFDHLDGYRGFLAILVVCQHSVGHLHFSGDYHIFDSIGNFVGVSGFFALSSFLLTLRLLKDFDKSIHSLVDSIAIVLKYATKRFCRIYMAFVIYVSILQLDVKFFGGDWAYSSWFSLVTLQSCGFSHLWTIAPEIKYYFLIPFISYAAIASRNYWKLCWTVSAAFVYLNYAYFNILNVQGSDFSLPNAFKLGTLLPMFLTGSLMTIAYYKLERSAYMSELKQPQIQKAINIVTVAMFLFGLRIFSNNWNEYNPEILRANKNMFSGLYWSIFLFLMLIGESNNYLSHLFASSSLLKSFGKYSFGIYLIHPMFIRLIRLHYFPRTDAERLLLVIGLSYVSGVLWFYVVENPLITIANRVCKFIDGRVSAKRAIV